MAQVMGIFNESLKGVDLEANWQERKLVRFTRFFDMPIKGFEK